MILLVLLVLEDHLLALLNLLVLLVLFLQVDLVIL
jgi:hypothetical protein